MPRGARVETRTDFGNDESQWHALAEDYLGERVIRASLYGHAGNLSIILALSSAKRLRDLLTRELGEAGQ